MQDSQNLKDLTIAAGPGSAKWKARVAEELDVLVGYLSACQDDDDSWVEVDCDEEGVLWTGKADWFHECERHTFDFSIAIPPNYPLVPFEICLPALHGKTQKMYPGGAICLDAHFSPVWRKKCPSFGVAHGLALGLRPWLAAELPVILAGAALN